MFLATLVGNLCEMLSLVGSLSFLLQVPQDDVSYREMTKSKEKNDSILLFFREWRKAR